MRLFVFIITGMLSLSSCTGDVVATINNQPITRKALEIEIHKLTPLYDPVFLAEPTNAAIIRQRALDNLIRDELILQAAREAHILPSQQELVEEINSMRGQYSIDEFNRMLSEHGLTADEWTNERRRKLKIDHYIRQQIIPFIQISPKAVKSYYLANRDRFIQPAAAQLQQILVANSATAKKIHHRLTQGANFSKLAMEYSISPEGPNGGNLGWVEPGSFPQPLASVAESLPIGKLSPIIHSKYGFHLFKVIARRPKRQQPLTEVRATIHDILLHEMVQNRYAAILEKLKKKATIDIDPSAVKRVPVP